MPVDDHGQNSAHTNFHCDDAVTLRILGGHFTAMFGMTLGCRFSNASKMRIDSGDMALSRRCFAARSEVVKTPSCSVNNCWLSGDGGPSAFKLDAAKLDKAIDAVDKL